mgnify:CR=1 FL=1
MSKCRKESKFDDCLYFTISRLFRIANKYAEDAFSDLEICPTHGYLMILLDEQREGLSVSEIADKLAIAPSTVTRFVDKLTEKGLVEREKEGKEKGERFKILQEIAEYQLNVLNAAEEIKMIDSDGALSEV